MAKTRALDVDGRCWRYKLGFGAGGGMEISYWRPWIPGTWASKACVPFTEVTPDIVANVIRGLGPRPSTAVEVMERSLRCSRER